MEPIRAVEVTFGPTVLLEKGRHAGARLKHGVVQIQVQAVNPFAIQPDLLCRQLTDRLFSQLGRGPG